jgi:hypothetical protein
MRARLNDRDAEGLDRSSEPPPGTSVRMDENAGECGNSLAETAVFSRPKR